MPAADATWLLSQLWSPLVVVTASAHGRRGAMIAVSAFAADFVMAAKTDRIYRAAH